MKPWVRELLLALIAAALYGLYFWSVFNVHGAARWW